ncbi:MAG: phosphate signaling complex protein PhoU [Sutterellaceae bacterium]|nr:phosphate signaling complex protein PhoU [Burkholderiaceae bacterium]MCX7901750.1 phosphate signaling complex protein PhoU [Burkholderiaceae bacterium]MDW8430452.1 phosphate signaling complex protein PhoU [Sutterellaceae bacterium]
MSGGEHFSKQYDQELEAMRSRVLQMGGIVEAQIKSALDAFENADPTLADSVIQADRRVNQLEIDLDRLVNHVIARRQPTAVDLRMIMGVAKTITDLERIGDEATKIARAAKWIREKNTAARVNRIPDIRASGDIAHAMLRRSLDAFARLDAQEAATIIRDDAGVDERFRAILRQLVTFMMEDPRSISASIDTVWVAKAIERIGDHAKNIAEHVIFIAHGADVKHMSPEDVARAVEQAS